MKLVVNLKAGTRVVEISNIIVAENIRIVLVTTLPNINNEDNSIKRVNKFVLLDFFNNNREKLLS